MKILQLSLLVAAFGALILPASAEKLQTPVGEAPGPWMVGAVGDGKRHGDSVKTTALMGIAMRVGEHGEAAVVYDLDLCRMACARTGKFNAPMDAISRGDFLSSMGKATFATGRGPGFVFGGAKDFGTEAFGLSPREQPRFKGFYVNGNKTILKWDIGGVEVLEMPKYTRKGDAGVFSRALEVGPSSKPLVVRVCGVPKGMALSDLMTEDEAEWETRSHSIRALWCAGNDVCLWRILGGDLCLEIPAHRRSLTVCIHVAISPKIGGWLNHDNFYALSWELCPHEKLASLIRSGEARRGHE